jgi:pyruvate dehydrogenase E1 component beta subunit
MSIAEALREALREEMRRDSRVFCVGEDIGIEGGFGGAFTVTLGLSEEFGHERILDTPISEIGIAGVAIGAAMAGLRPKVPMVMRAPVGATRRGAQHAQSLEAFFTHIPGLKVVAPATAYDAKGLLKSAIRDDNPVIFFEHKLLYGSKGPRSEAGALSPIGEVPDEEYLVPIGQGIIRRSGQDVTIVGKLLTMYRALAAAEQLAQEGIEAEVIDPRTLVPLDKDLILESVRKTGRLVVVESAPDTPAPFAPVMEEYYVPSEERVVAAVKSLF